MPSFTHPSDRHPDGEVRPASTCSLEDIDHGAIEPGDGTQQHSEPMLHTRGDHVTSHDCPPPEGSTHHTGSYHTEQPSGEHSHMLQTPPGNAR